MEGLTTAMILPLLQIGAIGLVWGWFLKFAEALLDGRGNFPFSNFIPISNMLVGAWLGKTMGIGEIWGLAAAGAGSAGAAELLKLIPGLSVKGAATATTATTAKLLKKTPTGLP